MADTDTIVVTEQLTKIYGSGAVSVTALDHVDLTIHRGEMLAVMGPSGSGKSTLLNMLGALDRPSSGRVLIDGQDLAQIKDIDAFRSRMVGFVFQMHNLIPTLTALENAEVPLRGRRMSSRARRDRAREMLALVELSDREDHIPAQLSGGQRQRVAIARALVNEPRLILADEPTGNLDTSSGEAVMALLQRLNNEHGATILVVTHDRAVARCTQRILTMRDGKIIDEHIVGDPLTEDLHALAHSSLGERLLAQDMDALHSLALANDGELTPAARELVRLLQRAH